MQMIDRGRGLPLVLIPGIQGRWEYLQPTVEALARSFRVVTFRLLGDRASERQGLDASREMDRLADQVATALDRLDLERAIICGISFGGLIAVHVAARHPGRTAALVLVSTPGPDFHLSPRHSAYARAPWLFGPLFLAETPRRLHPEVKLAFPRIVDRWRFGLRQATTLLTAPLSLSGMAARARLIDAARVEDDCTRVTAPALVITGERMLDRVVRVDSTLGFVHLIRGARAAELTGTGHIGYLTCPERFAALVNTFVSSTGTAKHDAA
jgi:pimeloyl-ACP methyl ester carboxylesterase